MKPVLAFFLAAALLAPCAAAQTPNPVMEHFRAYTAALARNDFAAAEHEANLALAASEQRDGDGGRTAVLSLNLATASLLAGHGSEALTPARRARDLARSNPASGVDPLQADLIVARAELASEITVAADHAQDALDRAGDRADLAGDVNATASALGARAFADRNFDRARRAYELAARTSQAAAIDPDIAHGYADIGIAASIIMGSGGQHLRDTDAVSADNALRRATTVFLPYGRREPPDSGLSAGQRAYTQVLAWGAALRSKLRSDGAGVRLAEPDVQRLVTGPVELGPQVARCDVRFAPTPLPSFPRGMLNQGGIGAVIMLVRSDENGEVVRHDVVAAVGQSFVEAVNSPRSRWRAERLPTSEPGCSMATWAYVPFAFVILP